MLKKAVIYLLLLTSLSGFAQVGNLKSEADQAYISEDYSKATELYEQILSQEYVSAEVHYNLGNAYFKTGNIAPAILHFERAKKLAPNDEDIIFNLKLANLS
ncbi:MAG: tetratricopeptide repeat protein, partial [Flavobacteriales bacterium]|nr:tetratricopeptide repeat protein [Flavobacteriales bacterium]